MTKTDTVVIKDTALTVSILTANSWKLQELRGVKNNVAFYYLRGGSSNTETFDNEYITFNVANNGTYHTNAGDNASMTSWAFINADSTAMTIHLTYTSGADYDLYWENLRYKNASLMYDEYYHDAVGYSHASGIRTVK